MNRLVWFAAFILAAKIVADLTALGRTLAAFLHVDAATISEMARQLVWVTVPVMAMLWNRLFRLILVLSPAMALFVMEPALTFWSWDVVDGAARNSAPSWYGVDWVQGIGVLLLAIIPVAWPTFTSDDVRW